MKKKTIATKTKFDKDGYSRGPNLKGTRVPDFLPPPGQITRKQPDVEITIKIDPFHFNILQREASRRDKAPDEFLGKILGAHAEAMQ